MSIEKANRIIAFVSQKGGVGKSTLARATAVELIKNSYTVAIADLDIKQETILLWNRIRQKNETFLPINSVDSYATLETAVKACAEYDFLIIDAAASSNAETLAIASIADFVIQPSGAGLDDLIPGVLLFHELVKADLPRSKLWFALCRLATPTEYISAREYLSAVDYNVLKGYVFERASYKTIQNEGGTIAESKYSSLKKQADELIQSIFDNFALWLI